MYSKDTRFLTKGGWRLFDDLTEEDHLAFDDNDAIKWLTPKQAGIRHYDFPVPLLESQIGKSGKFCIASDVPIRFFVETKNGIQNKFLTLSDIRSKLQRMDFLPGYIRGSLPKPKVESSLSNLSARIAFMFNHVHEIDTDGKIRFSISRGLRKQEALDFLLKAGVRTDQIILERNNTKFIVEIATYEEIVESVLTRPELLARVLENSLNYGRGNGKKSVKVLRFYCPRVTELAQLAMCLTEYNSKMIYDEVAKGRMWALIVEPSKTSICFRNRVIVLSTEQESICVKEPHPITQYQGRISIL